MRGETMPIPALLATLNTELSPREYEVLELVSEGYQYAEVAKELNISLHTVKSHMVNIRARLGARTTAHAVALWIVG